MAEIMKGDVVKLKSGGMKMTVQEVRDFSDSEGIEDGVKCVWFDKGMPRERFLIGPF